MTLASSTTLQANSTTASAATVPSPGVIGMAVPRHLALIVTSKVALSVQPPPVTFTDRLVVPGSPAVNSMAAVPSPLSMVPLTIDQWYVAPPNAVAVTSAVRRCHPPGATR